MTSRVVSVTGRALASVARLLREYAQPFVCRTKGPSLAQELLAVPTLLIPIALLVVTVGTIAQAEFYQPDCTLALLQALSGKGSQRDCTRVPLTGDWPSVVGGAIALAMFLLYRRLSLLIGDFDTILFRPVANASVVASAPPLFAALTNRPETPSKMKYAVPWLWRLAFLAGAAWLGVATYALAYDRGDWFTILGGQGFEGVLRHHWWANWHVHPVFASFWVLTASATIYLGLDNFLTSSRISRDLGRLLRDDAVRAALPFVPNLPSRRTAWNHLHGFLGEMQYGAFTAVGSASITTVLVVRPDDTTWISVALVGNGAFLAVLALRFSAFKSVLEGAARAVVEREVRALEKKQSEAVAAGRFDEAAFRLQEVEQALRYGPLPVLAARQVTVRLVAITTATVSLVATVVQTLG